MVDNSIPIKAIERKIRAYVIENMLLGPDNGFENNTSLIDAGILDSTGAVELVAFLQEHYNIFVEDQEITPENLDSVDRICAFVLHKQKTARLSA